MTNSTQSGLFLYAKNLERLAGFYQTILQLSRLKSTDDMVVLQGQNLQLIVHAIPAHIALTIEISTPPQHREDVALKFFFSVPSIEAANVLLITLGGEVMQEIWQGPGFRVCNACDPEGNIFQLRDALI